MRIFTAIILILSVFAAAAYAEMKPTKEWQSDVCKDSAAVVTETTKSTVDNTAKVLDTSVKNTPSAPIKAVEAVNDTAGTIFESADKALKTLTADEG